MDALASSEVTFKKVAGDWLEVQGPRWGVRHTSDVRRSLERDVYPSRGALPMREITTPMVLDTLGKIERRGAIETARRLRQRISGVFGYAMAKSLALTDPAPASTVKVMKAMPKAGKQPALLRLDELRQLLGDVEAEEASPVTKLASRLLALTAVRPGVVAAAVWGEFKEVDWEGDPSPAALWRIPASRMKLKLDRKEEELFEHLVPLSAQAVDVVKTIQRLTGRTPFLFPNHRHTHKPMSSNAVGYLYNRAGCHGRHVPHGWRAAFSTVMNERAERAARAGRDADRKIIDLMLAHVPKDKVESAYNRAAFMDRKREIAIEWADLLMEGKAPAAALLEGRRQRQS